MYAQEKRNELSILFHVSIFFVEVISHVSVFVFRPITYSTGMAFRHGSIRLPTPSAPTPSCGSMHCHCGWCLLLEEAIRWWHWGKAATGKIKELMYCTTVSTSRHLQGSVTLAGVALCCLQKRYIGWGSVTLAGEHGEVVHWLGKWYISWGSGTLAGEVVH